MDRIIDKTIPKGPDEHLEKQVRNDLAFLFADFGAKIISNRHLPGIGNAAIIIESENLRFRVVQNCGRIRFAMAPSRNSKEWKNVGFVLMDFEDNPTFDMAPGSLEEQAHRLRQTIGRVNEAFSKTQHRATERNLRHAAKMRLAGVKKRPNHRPNPIASILQVLAPILRPAVKLIAAMVYLIFPSARNSSEPNGSNETFIKQIREELSFLFVEFGAKIISSCYYYYAFGNSCVALDVENVRVRVHQGRGEFSADFSSLQAPWKPKDIKFGLMAIEMKDDVIPPMPSFRTLRQLSEMLHPKFRQLSEACSPEHYPELKRRLELIDETSRKNYYEAVKRRQLESQSYKPGGTLGRRL